MNGDHAYVSRIERKFLKDNRPSRSQGRTDKYLEGVASDLRRVIRREQKDYKFHTCQLGNQDAEIGLAIALTEFAEDVHCDLGLWRGLETCNEQIFGTPLPFFVEEGDAVAVTAFDPRRVQFLLWKLLPIYKEDEHSELILGPHHQDLRQLAEAISRYLTEHFAKMPQDSGISQFLDTTNTHAGDIKRKLVWVGLRSYLFRQLFTLYAADQKRPVDIAMNDDFICQECTEWSGLGAIDILTQALNLEGRDRSDLMSWAHRHTAFYRVKEVERHQDTVESITALNIVNDRDYRIYVGLEIDQFQTESVIFGSLVPWRQSWYWSGEQRILKGVSEAKEAELRQTLLRDECQIAYRYRDVEADIARDLVKKNHEKFLAYYENDLVVFPDGKSLAESEQNRIAANWTAASSVDRKQAMLKHGLTKEGPTINFPKSLLDHERGIATFSSPVGGQEHVTFFHDLIEALDKKDDDKTDSDSGVVRGVITCDTVSSEFIQRVVRDHGAEAIATTFLIRDQPLALVIEYILRCHKGEYYRTRYPRIVVMEK